MIHTAMVVHYVDDMTRALRFYKEAIGLVSTVESDGWSQMRVTDTFELGLHSRDAREAGKHPFDAFETTLVLNTDDLDGCCELIVQNGGTLDRIVEPHDGIPVRMALVRDPAGNGFQVNQHVG